MKFLRRFEAQKQLLVIDMDMYVQFHGWLMEKRLIHMMMIFLFFRSFLDGESVKCAWNERNFEPDMKLRGLIERNVTLKRYFAQTLRDDFHGLPPNFWSCRFLWSFRFPWSPNFSFHLHWPHSSTFPNWTINPQFETDSLFLVSLTFLDRKLQFSKRESD